VDAVPEGQIPNRRHRSAYPVGGNGSKASVVSGGFTPETGRLGRSPRSEFVGCGRRERRPLFHAGEGAVDWRNDDAVLAESSGGVR